MGSATVVPTLSAFAELHVLQTDAGDLNAIDMSVCKHTDCVPGPLRNMITSGIDARLVKVAAIGLDPHKHLGKSIAQMEPTLIKLRDLYGCNVCGEGGEYETLTLDCPAFQHGRIVLDDWGVRDALDGCDRCLSCFDSTCANFSLASSCP